jgi:Ni/Co efflux regulator RcnB
MKTLLAAMLLVVSVGTSFASENQASECQNTLHSDERENSKTSLEDGSQKKEREQSATSV